MGREQDVRSAASAARAFPSGARWRSAYGPLIIANLLAVALIVVWSNWHDWDAFYAQSEADVRSYLVYREPPIWSYPLCGGVTRIGDPLAFSFSPMFALPLALGVVWGLKAMMLALTLAGVYFAQRLFRLFHGDAADAWALATLVAAGNYLLWHYYVGHVPFAEVHLGLGIIYFHLACLLSPLSRRRLAAAAGLVFLCFSGGFYQTAAFVLLPFGISLSIFLAVTARVPDKSRALRQMLLFDGAGLLAAAYRWIPAVWYQLGAPRSVEARPEAMTLVDAAKYAFLPTAHFRFLGFIPNRNTYLLGEYSFFSPVNWLAALCAAACIHRRFGRGRRGNTPSVMSHPLFGWLALHAAVCAALMLGDLPIASPFRLLNALVFHDSLRVAARFSFGLVLAAAAWVALGLEGGLLGSRRSGAAFLACALGLNLLNCATFRDRLSLSSLREALRRPSAPAGPMRASVFVASPLDGTFRAIRENLAVLNCYDDLSRDETYLVKMVRDKSYRPEALSFIDRPSAQSPECLRESYFTANSIHLSEHCRAPVCLRLNAIGPRDRGRFFLDPRESMYCLRPRS